MKTNNNMQSTMKYAYPRHAQISRIQPRLWLWFMLVLTFAGLSALAQPTVSRATTFLMNGTVPPPPETLTILVGPVESVSPTTMVVAGIPVERGDAPVDERVGPLDAPDAWVRVEGFGNGNGGLTAERIKVLPSVPMIRLTGPLDELAPLDSATQVSVVMVDGIPINRTATTLVIGDPIPTEDRVSVRAAIESTGELLALQVVKVNPVPDDPDDDDEDEPGKTILTGVVDSMPENGINSVSGDGLIGAWIISGIPVEVTADTEISARVGLLEVGAWIKVKGIVDGGTLIAERIKTTHTHQFHKLVGELEQLNELEVIVDGITIDRSETSAVRGDPQPGSRVVVKMLPTLTGHLAAVLIEARGNQQGPPDQPGLVVKFTGRVDALPADGLYGQWTVAGRSVTVPQGAFIDEHKGTVQVGAFVEVAAILGADNSLTAVVIVVTRPVDDGDNDDDDNDHGDWTELRGTIESLPDDPDLHGDWTVSGVTVRVNERTDIRDRNNEPTVGARVKVWGWELDDGSVRAKRIEVKEDPNPEITFIGAISELPSSGLIGTWNIVTPPDVERTVQVSNGTELKDRHGPFAVGKLVKVRGHIGPDDVVSAKKIESLPDPVIQFTGAIVSFPGNLEGNWVIADGSGEREVVTSGETEFKQHHGAFGEGVYVKVKGRLNGDVVEATKIETLRLPKVEYVGEIRELPDTDDLTGLWKIGRLTFEVTDQTELDHRGRHGGDDDGYAIGVWVKVEGRARASGIYIADEIKILRKH